MPGTQKHGFLFPIKKQGEANAILRRFRGAILSLKMAGPKRLSPTFLFPT